nr:nuclear envelope pore membrane protein POM 121C-like [Dasypus novemcinctus]
MTVKATPAEGRGGAERLLMGSYLSRRRPPPPSPGLRGQDQPSSPDGRWPAHPVLGARPDEQVRSDAPALEPARGLSSEDRVASACGGRRFVIVHPRRCPVQLDRCLFMGVFSSAPRSGYLKPALSAGSARMLCTSVILTMAPTKDKPALHLALTPAVAYTWPSLSAHFPNTRVTLMSALGEGNTTRALEELAALGERRRATGQQEDDDTVPERPGDRGRGSHAGGRGQSAFKPLRASGVLSSFVPKPGPLKSEPRSRNAEDSLGRKSPPSFRSSCRRRNAITSSYSSTAGFLPLQRRGASAPRLSGSVSSHSQVPAKKLSEEGHPSGSSGPGGSVSGRQVQGEKVSDAPSRQKQNWRNCSPTSNSARPRKRKIPLLLPCRRRDPLTLPAPLQLSGRVTAEDLDLEKRAAIQWINKVLTG